MKRLFISFVLAVAALFVGCDNNKEAGESFLRHDFDAATFALELGEDFEEYRQINADYIIESKSTENRFVMGGYVEIDGVKSMLRIAVKKSRYGKVESIVATPEDSSHSKTLMLYYLNNSDAENLGNWQGANWKKISGGMQTGGVYQFVDNALQQIAAGLENLTIDALYAIVSGRAYASVTIENAAFKLSLVESFYRIDFDVLTEVLGSSWSKLQSDNRYTSYKMNFGTLNYIWFDYALDVMDNVFNVSAYTDEQKLFTQTIRLTMPEDIASDVQVEAWKHYVQGDEVLALGEFRKAYLAESNGTEVSPLASQQAVLEYVETNGRPDAFAYHVVVEYLKGDMNIVITLDPKYVTIDLYR